MRPDRRFILGLLPIYAAGFMNTELIDTPIASRLNTNYIAVFILSISLVLKRLLTGRRKLRNGDGKRRRPWLIGWILSGATTGQRLQSGRFGTRDFSLRSKWRFFLFSSFRQSRFIGRGEISPAKPNELFLTAFVITFNNKPDCSGFPLQRDGAESGAAGIACNWQRFSNINPIFVAWPKNRYKI